MTNHPITPSPELVEQWFDNSPIDRGLTLATQAAQWGADQQLEACCEQVKSIPSPFGVPLGEMASNALRNACRPKPLSLKEEALAVIENSSFCDHLSPQDEAILRKALESL